VFAPIDRDRAVFERPSDLVREWTDDHRGALVDDWERAQKREPLLPIPPLP